MSLPHVIRKGKNNTKVNSPRVIINARIMANKKWKTITRGKRIITRGLLENFLQKVPVLNVPTISVWIHVITLCVLCVSAFIKFLPFWFCLPLGGSSGLGECLLYEMIKQVCSFFWSSRNSESFRQSFLFNRFIQNTLHNSSNLGSDYGFHHKLSEALMSNRLFLNERYFSINKSQNYRAIFVSPQHLCALEPLLSNF